MIVREYIVRADGHYTQSATGMLLYDPIKGMPSRGTILHAPRGHPGMPGDRIYFQWNALLSPDEAAGGVVIPPSLVYRAGNAHLNGYLFCRLHQHPVNDWGITLDGNQYGQGEVISCPVSDWLKPGNDIIFEPKLAHRVEAEEFSSEPVYALKIENVLMYR